MAVATKRVIDDQPRGGIAHEVRLQLNQLLTDIDAAADFAALKVSVAANARRLITTIDVPQPPQFPTP